MRSDFDTATVDSPERFSYWHEVVCKSFVAAKSRNRTRQEFDARLSTRKLGALGISRMRAPSHGWDRDPAHIRADGHDEFLLSILLNGTGCLEQCGRQVYQAQGDIVLYDTGRPFSYQLDSDIMLVKIPRRSLLSRDTKIEELTAVLFPKSVSLNLLVLDIVKQYMILDMPPETEAIVAPKLVGSLIDLISTLFDVRVAENAGLDARHANALERTQRAVSLNLEDPEMSVDKMAKYGAVSKRTLNRIFAAIGTTPMRWVWHRRLDASYAALLHRRVPSVTAAALQFGFSDLSHFSRSFKAAHGVTPEQVLLGRG